MNGEKKMAKVRCKACGTEIEVIQTNKGKSCGCDNHTYLKIDRNGLPGVTADDLNLVTSIEGFSKPKSKKVDKPVPSDYTKRVPRKLEFEVR
jgi:ssDNA-binding Zn-finger/Zn-ribbon topoisomerase 1